MVVDVSLALCHIPYFKYGTCVQERNGTKPAGAQLPWEEASRASCCAVRPCRALYCTLLLTVAWLQLLLMPADAMPAGIVVLPAPKDAHSHDRS